MNVAEVKLLQKIHFNDNQDKFLQYIHDIIPDQVICALREKQFGVCMKLEEYGKAAKAVLELRNTFSLTGDFSNFATLAKKVKAFAILSKNLAF